MRDQEIIKKYEEGHSTYDLATLYKTYPNKIRRILIKNGVELKTKSEAQKNAIENGKSLLPTKGKCRTKEEKLKISRSLKKRWSKIDEKTYNEYVKKAKERWDSMSVDRKKEMQDLAIKAIRLAGIEGSKLEKFLKVELEELGHNVQVHKKNLIPNENLEIDLYLPDIKTIIEVDGPSHFLPIWGEEKLQKQIKSDSQKTGLILSKGFVIIRIKHLSDSLSLVDREKMKDQLIGILDGISNKFPSKPNRYIEIEA